MKLGGTLIAHNALQFDYCIKEAITSLCDCCDITVLLEAESTDGTRQLFEWFEDLDSYNVFITDARWSPNEQGRWLSDLTNDARRSLSEDYGMHLNLQADEVLHEDDYHIIRTAAQTGRKFALRRLNFWMDHRHILPDGQRVGTWVTRLAPTSVPSVGDAESLDPTGSERLEARIFHYGFIRATEAFVKKSREMQQAFFNIIDPIINAIETNGPSVLVDPAWPTAVPKEKLLPYTGTHPKVAHGWLKEHGFDL